MDFNHILNDRESGSVTLLNRLIEVLEKDLHGTELKIEDYQSRLQNLREQLFHFAAIENFLTSLIRHTGNSKNFSGEALRFIAVYKFYWQGSEYKIAENFLEQNNPSDRTIFTHSHSETVISLLKQLHIWQIPFRVLQSLSFPGEEGRLSVERMRQLKIKAELIEDTDIQEALRKSDIILMGCDALLPAEFLNKIGSRSILEEAKKLSRQTILVTETRKKVNRPEWKNELPEQALFEWVPLSLIDRIVSEKEN